MNFLNFARTGLSALAVLATTFGLSGVAAAQDYTSTSQTSIAGPVNPGSTVQVSGTSAAGCELEIIVDGVMLSSSTVPSGDYSVPFTVPADLTAGNHGLVIELCGEVTSNSEFTVAATAAAQQDTTNDDQLALTGGEAMPIAQVGLVLLAAGGFFLVLRKRNTADSAA